MSFFKIGKRKKERVEGVLGSPEEKMLLLKEEFRNKQNEIEVIFEKKERQIKEKYQKLDEQESITEKNVPFEKVIFEAESEKHPLVYEITRSNDYAKYYIFSRGRYTTNPYRIEINNQKNVMFLMCYDEKAEDEPFIFLHYDRAKKQYTEYAWHLDVDYVEKHQIKQFLFELMKSIEDERLEFYKKVRHYYSTFFAFERTLNSTEFKWKSELKKDMDLIKAQKEASIALANRDYKKKSSILEEEIQKKLGKRKIINESDQIKIKDDLKSVSLNVYPVKERVLKRDEKMADAETQESMNRLFRRVYDLLEFENLMDSRSRHNLSALYEKDIHELWYGFINLSEERKVEEKQRFLSLHREIHDFLDEVDSNLDRLRMVDYEKKMLFLEEKYRNNR
jgi:hypothetical protein